MMHITGSATPTANDTAVLIALAERFNYARVARATLTDA